MTAEQRAIADRERPTAQCARRGEGGCYGAICVSHPLGRKVQKRWMWIWCCYRHHQGDLQNEQIGRLHAYRQATEEMIKMTYPKTWGEKIQDKKFLEKTYSYLL